MAATLESVFNGVQELAMDRKTLPENYVYKDGIAASDVSLPVLDIPTIDVNCLASSSPSAHKELEKLRTTLSSSGYFQAINHGMTNSFIDEVYGTGREFFALPLKEKRKWSRTDENIEGYGNDSILFENQTLDWTDRLYLHTMPEDQRKLQFWPQNPEKFRKILEEYTENLKKLNEVILKALARLLNLNENCFFEQYGENPNMVARFNYYPPCPRPDLTLGCKPHSDGSAITFLLQDKEVEGLQVLKDDQWFRVPIIPNALLVNVGDQAEIMSNGIFKSTLHRVVTNTERERISLAMFCVPETGKEIEPVEELVSETRPRVYKKVKDYVNFYFEIYQQGKRPIEAAKI